MGVMFDDIRSRVDDLNLDESDERKKADRIRSLASSLESAIDEAVTQFTVNVNADKVDDAMRSLVEDAAKIAGQHSRAAEEAIRLELL